MSEMDVEYQMYLRYRKAREEYDQAYTTMRNAEKALEQYIEEKKSIGEKKKKQTIEDVYKEKMFK